MFENLADKGIKQRGSPDTLTINIYHPEVIAAKSDLDLAMGGALEITSGYRDHNVDPAVKNSPHKFAIALDLAAGSLESQIRWGYVAIFNKYFTRCGIYPDRGIIHLDIADPEWIKTYNGTRFWVCLGDTYTGFESWIEMINFARGKND